MYDEAVKMFEYIEESPSGKVKRKGGDFGGTIEGRIVTCKGVFYIKQHTMFADDLIDINQERIMIKNFRALPEGKISFHNVTKVQLYHF